MFFVLYDVKISISAKKPRSSSLSHYTTRLVCNAIVDQFIHAFFQAWLVFFISHTSYLKAAYIYGSSPPYGAMVVCSMVKYRSA